MFAVIELQKLNDTTLANIVAAYEDLNEAKSRYHTILAAAAISSVPLHSALIITDDAFLIERDSFVHGIQPEPAPEQEGE